MKDLLWIAMNSESNKLHDIQSEKIVHKDKDLSFLQHEVSDLGEDEDLKHWGEEVDDDLELDWDDDQDSDWADEPSSDEVKWEDVEELEDFEYEDLGEE